MQAIRDDAKISPLCKLVAIEIADVEITRIDDLFESLVDEHLSKSRVIAAVLKQPDMAARTRMLALANDNDWLWATAQALRAIVDRDDQTKECYRAAADAADELLGMNPESLSPAYKQSAALRTIGGAYFHVGRYEESIRLSRRAIAVNTKHDKDNDALSWCRIAMSQFKLGQVKESRASLKSATEAALGTQNEDLSKLLATATKLISPPATQPASKPALSTPPKMAPAVVPSTR